MDNEWHTLLLQFHFLRPAWLLLLLPCLALMWWLPRRAISSNWFAHIDPTLLRALLQQPQHGSHLTPIRLMCITLLIWLLALAGPSYTRQVSPLVDDKADLIIALHLSQSMLDEDLRPNKLTLAKLKIAGLLAKRKGARSALLVYSGSAHDVIPLTEDQQIIDLYLHDLSPDIMPIPGNRDDLAFKLAQQLLSENSQAGSLIVVSNKPPTPAFIQAIGNPSKAPNAISIQFLSVTSPVNERGFNPLDSITLTADDTDIETLLAGVNRHYQNYLLANQQSQWRDDGDYLLWPLLVLLLLWYRQGMVLQW